MKPTASCEAAQLWVRELSHLSHKCSPKGDLHILDNVDDGWSRFAEPREGERESARPTAALLRSLQWVSDGYVSPRDTTLIDVLL